MARESLMSGKVFILMSVICLTAVPVAAAAQSLDTNVQSAPKQDDLSQGRSETGGGSYGDQNRGGSRGFYAFPSHRSVGDRGKALAERSFSPTDPGIPAYGRSTHGSAYYGRDYGAPYFKGGYYDNGVYYRERRD